MKTIHICIGSACHLKGSYEVIDQLQKEIKKDKREEEIIIKASFCLGHCTEAVSVKVDDSPIMTVSPRDTKAFYDKVIMGAFSQ